MVDQNAWWTIQHLDLKMDFLQLLPADWSECDSYQESRNIIESLNFINDAAERGVCLSNDFTKAARSEDHYQNVLQVVEDNRFKKPNIRKKHNKD